MTKPELHIPVLIVGGGPVGLFLAISLLKKGVQCKVIEKRKNPVPDSRSLGIHPVSLELFDELGIAHLFLKEGIKIQKGIALNEKGIVGEISFETCPKPHNYILACPQRTTESILRKELSRLAPDALITRSTFKKFLEEQHAVLTTFSDPDGKERVFQSDVLIGCDGKNSLVRQQASIHYSGKRYPDTYIMGDFEDTTDFGNKAAVFLPKNGLIESFPLPNGIRRWVVKTDKYIQQPAPEKIADMIHRRVGYKLYNVNNTMTSSFGVQHFMAEFFRKGRILLAGDAAHVVSPIGGQGMNLGWLGSEEMAVKLSEMYSQDNKLSIDQRLNNFEKQHKKRVQKAAKRAELNMILGRRSRIPFFKNIIIKTILTSPIDRKLARLFTMRNLKSGWL